MWSDPLPGGGTRISFCIPINEGERLAVPPGRRRLTVLNGRSSIGALAGVSSDRRFTPGSIVRPARRTRARRHQLQRGSVARGHGTPPISVNDPRFTQISAYGVSAEVPDDWVVTPAEDEAFATGVSASPGPGRLVPGEQGLLATRVDATQVGAPSDLYYLAAKGP